MRSRSENFVLRACLCALVLIESIASWLIAASSNDLFTPAVARNLDREIEKIAKRNNLPSLAVDLYHGIIRRKHSCCQRVSLSSGFAKIVGSNTQRLLF